MKFTGEFWRYDGKRLVLPLVFRAVGTWYPPFLIGWRKSQLKDGRFDGRVEDVNKQVESYVTIWTIRELSRLGELFVGVCFTALTIVAKWVFSRTIFRLDAC